MKRVLLILLAAFMATAFGCSNIVEPVDPNTPAYPNTNPHTAAGEESASVSEVVEVNSNETDTLIVDWTDVRIYYMGMSESVMKTPQVDVRVESKGDLEMRIDVENLHVNNVPTDNQFRINLAPGEIANEGIVLISGSLEQNGIEEDDITDIEFSFLVTLFDLRLEMMYEWRSDPIAVHIV